MTAKATPSPASVNKPPPPRWGADELTKFLDLARDNQWASFANKPSVRTLIAIDAEFAKMTNTWLNPQNQLAALLLIRCHAAFRAAAGLALAGQTVEAFVVGRSMLEFAAYAVHIHRDPSLEKVWFDRHDDEASMKAQRDAFSHGKVLASVTAASLDAGKRFDELYRRTIDFGGHPNERSITGNAVLAEEPGRRIVQQVMLHADGIHLDHVLKSVAQCGLVSLEMLQVVFNARFELLGINAAMLSLRKAL